MLYLVQPGDTLLEIAIAFGTSAEAIMLLNDISDPELVFAGATLSVPVDYTDPVS